MLKKAKIYGVLGLILNILLVAILSKEEGLFASDIISFLHLENNFLGYLLENVLIIEHGALITGRAGSFLGIGFICANLVALILLKDMIYKKVLIAGSMFLVVGLGIMGLLGVSIIGWLAGSFLLIAGILAIDESKKYL